MARAVWPAVQITLFGGSVQFLAARGARHVARARRERREYGIEVMDHALLATNHHAITALQSPHSAARPHVHVVNPSRREVFGAPDIIHIIGITAVDEDIFRLKKWQKVSDGFLHGCR